MPLLAHLLLLLLLLLVPSSSSTTTYTTEVRVSTSSTARDSPSCAPCASLHYALSTELPARLAAQVAALPSPPTPSSPPLITARILLDSGTYPCLNQTFTGGLITSAGRVARVATLELASQSPDSKPKLTGLGSAQVLHVRNVSLVLRGVEVHGGVARFGGGVLAECAQGVDYTCSLTVREAVLHECVATGVVDSPQRFSLSLSPGGGALFVRGFDVISMHSSVVANNSAATSAGAGVLVHGLHDALEVTVEDCEFLGNQAATGFKLPVNHVPAGRGGGGGMLVLAKATNAETRVRVEVSLLRTTFIENYARGVGPAFGVEVVSDADLSFSQHNNLLLRNYGHNCGAAVTVVMSYIADVNIDSSHNRFIGSRMYYSSECEGAGFCLYVGSREGYYSTIRSRHSFDLFEDNMALALGGSGGGAIEYELAGEVNTTDIAVDNCTFTNNRADGMIQQGSNPTPGGGALRVLQTRTVLTQSKTSVRDCTFQGNMAEYRGGSIYFESRDSIHDQVIEIERCTFTNEHSRFHAGAVSVWTSMDFDGLDFVVRDSVFRNCSARNRGGAVLLTAGGKRTRFSVVLDNCTFVDNHIFADHIFWTDGGALELIVTATSARADVNITDCVFRRNRAARAGGALSVRMSSSVAQLPIVLNIHRTEFEDNSACVLGGAISTDGKVIFRMSSSSFRNNWLSCSDALLDFDPDHVRATADVSVNRGGADIAMQADPSQTIQRVPRGECRIGSRNCLGKEFYLDKSIISDTTFTGGTLTTTGSSGGSVLLIDSYMQLQNVVMVRSEAALFGGCIFLLGVSGLDVFDSLIGPCAASRGREIFSLSSGPLTIRNSIISMSVRADGVSDSLGIISGGLLNVTESQLSCPFGYNPDSQITKFQRLIKGGSGFGAQVNLIFPGTSAQIFCQPCPPQSYTLGSGSIVGSTDDVPVLSKCKPCPSGGVCFGADQIVARPNFWGTRTVPAPVLFDPTLAGTPADRQRVQLLRDASAEIKFTMCNGGMCCSRPASQDTFVGGVLRNAHPGEETCLAYDHCPRHRTGLVCSACLEGYGEAFGSASCVPEDECTDGPLFFALSTLLALLIATYLVFAPKGPRGVLEVAWYFFQATNQLLVGTSSASGYQQRFEQLTAVFDFRLNFGSSDQSFSFCVRGGMTALDKMVWAGFFPALVLSQFVLLYTGWRVVRWLRRRVCPPADKGEDEQDYEEQLAAWKPFERDDFAQAPSSSKLSRVNPMVERSSSEANVPLLSDDSGTSVESTPMMTPSDSNASDPHEAPRLTQDHMVSARVPLDRAAQSHRWVAGATLFLLLIYTSMVMMTMRMLHCIEINGLEHHGMRLMLAADEVECFQPWQWAVMACVVFLLLPAPFLLWWLLSRWRARWFESSAFLWHVDGQEAVFGVLTLAFRQRYWYWGPVILLRRLLFVTVSTFVVDNFLRPFLMATIATVFLMVHIVAKPYRHRMTLHLETYCLFALAFIGVVETRDGVFFNQGISLEDLDRTSKALYAMQAILLAIPLLVVLSSLLKPVYRSLSGRKRRGTTTVE